MLADQTYGHGEAENYMQVVPDSFIPTPILHEDILGNSEVNDLTKTTGEMFWRGIRFALTCVAMLLLGVFAGRESTYWYPAPRTAVEAPESKDTVAPQPHKQIPRNHVDPTPKELK